MQQQRQGSDELLGYDASGGSVVSNSSAPAAPFVQSRSHTQPHIRRTASLPAQHLAVRPRDAPHARGVCLEDVHSMWLVAGKGVERQRHLLIEDLETGDVMMPLIDLKPVFHANYSRKVSALKNRQVDAPPGSELLAARPPGCTLYWQWALEAPPEVKDVIRHELGAENMSSGHLRLVLLPIVYNAMAAKEAQRKLPLFHALADALRRSSYYPLLKHPPPQAAPPGKAAEAPDAGAGAGEAPLFGGPRDLRATLRKHMVVLSEGDKMTEVLRVKRPRSSQGELERGRTPPVQATEGGAGASTCAAPSAAWVAGLRSELRAELYRELSRETGCELKRMAQEMAAMRSAFEGQIAELYYDLAAAKSCLMQLYGVILPGRVPEAQPPAAPAAQQPLQPLEHQAVTAGLPHVPSLDGLPGMCAADDAALRHAAAAELLSAGDPALGAALHNSLSVDSLAANAGAGREGSHDSTCTAGGAAAGLTGALLHAGGRQGPHGEETAAPDRVAPGEAMPSEGALEFLHQLVMQHQVGGREAHVGAVGSLPPAGEAALLSRHAGPRALSAYLQHHQGPPACQAAAGGGPVIGGTQHASLGGVSAAMATRARSPADMPHYLKSDA